MWLFDTDFLIDLVNGEERTVKKAQQMDEERAFKAISVVTAHEYLRGIFYLHSKNAKLLREKLRKAEAELARFEILPYTHEIVKVAAEVDAELVVGGHSLSFVDVVIAATALYHKLAVVTRNVEHFKRVPKLDVETY